MIKEKSTTNLGSIIKKHNLTLRLFVGAKRKINVWYIRFLDNIFV